MAQISFYRPQENQLEKVAGYTGGRNAIKSRRQDQLTRAMNGERIRCCKTGQWEVKTAVTALPLVLIGYFHPLNVKTAFAFKHVLYHYGLLRFWTVW